MLRVEIQQGRQTTFHNISIGENFVRAVDNTAPDRRVYRRIPIVMLFGESNEECNAVEIAAESSRSPLECFSSDTPVVPIIIQTISVGYDMRDRNELPF